MLNQHWGHEENIPSQPKACPFIFLRVSFDGEKLLLLINYNGSMSPGLSPCLLFKKPWSCQGHADSSLESLCAQIGVESRLVVSVWYPVRPAQCVESVPLPIELQWGFVGIERYVAMNTRSWCLV